MAHRPVCVLRSDVAGFESIQLTRDRSTIVIGRSRSVDYRIDHPQVSGLQCTVRLEQAPGTRVLVTDSSTNGTFVDGEEVARGETRELRPGSLMTLLVSTVTERDAEFAEEIPCFRVEMRPARPRAKQTTPSSRAAARADAGTVDRPRRASTSGLATPSAKRPRPSATPPAEPMLTEREEGEEWDQEVAEEEQEAEEEPPTLDSLLACELLTMVLSTLSSVAMLQASAVCKRLHAAASLVDEVQLRAPRGGALGPRQAEVLFGRFSLLRALRLHGRCLALGPACALVGRLLPRLEALELRGNELTGVGAIALAEQLEAVGAAAAASAATASAASADGGAGGASGGASGAHALQAPRALPLHTLELRNASLCAAKLPGQLAEEPTAALRLIRSLRFATNLVRLALFWAVRPLPSLSPPHHGGVPPPHPPSQVTLNLAGNALRPAAAATIAEALLCSVGARLRSLQLEQNYLGDEGARLLALALTPHAAPPPGRDDAAAPPSPNAPSAAAVETSAWPPPAAAAAAAAAAMSHGVEGVDASSAEDGGVAAHATGAAAPPRAPPPLLELRLDENFLTCASCPELGALLAANTTLRRLGLSNNGIDGAGGTQLADGLARNGTPPHGPSGRVLTAPQRATARS